MGCGNFLCDQHIRVHFSGEEYLLVPGCISGECKENGEKRQARSCMGLMCLIGFIIFLIVVIIIAIAKEDKASQEK